MMQNLLIILIIILSIIFIQLKHPLAMGLTLLMQTLLISLTLSMTSESYWFSYILFLVFTGGMMVLFIYVTSLASNETFSISLPMLLFFYIMIIISIFIMYFYDNMITNEFFTNHMKNLKYENILNLIKLFNYPTNLITILLMNYLLITLIAVVKITNIFYGPLRQMFN